MCPPAELGVYPHNITEESSWIMSTMNCMKFKEEIGGYLAKENIFERKMDIKAIKALRMGITVCPN
jgi:hypothetical protein